MSESQAAMFAALVKLQGDLPRIIKDETAQVRSDKGNYKYSYAGLDAVSDALLPRLCKYGLAFIARPTLNAEGKLVLAYSLVHESGEQVTGEYPLPQGLSPQGTGSAITYARRYCLLAVTGAAPADDDDDAAAAEAGYRRDSGDQGWQSVREPRQERPPAQETRRPTARNPEQQAGKTVTGGGEEEAEFVKDFVARTADANAAQIRLMRVELGRAVQAKTISPDSANDLGDGLKRRADQLRAEQ